MKKKFIEELTWRRMLHDVMPGTEEMLERGMVSGYIGFDPTADSLHVGNLVQIMTLLHFQQCGHKPVALVGGATGMVGDPSGKSAERNLLDESTLRHNQACIQRQLEKFLDFNSGVNAAEIVNNYDWFREYSFLSFIRDVGKHITVNYMLAKDSVQNRLENGMSFTEFSYQLVQGYDFFWLWKNKQISLQMGGSDQWGNIVTGTELIRKKEGGEAYAITTQLIKKADGTKFGKTETGNIWLDASKTSPYRYYQFWMNASDTDAAAYIRIFTLRGREEIEQLESEHQAAPHLRILQSALAKDITIRTHGEEAWKAAVETSEILFGKGTADTLKRMNDDDFKDAFSGVPEFEVSKELFNGQTGLVELLTQHTNILPSKGEARKMIEAGAVFLNKEKEVSLQRTLNQNDLINKKYLLVQKGKKNYYLVKAG